MATEERRSGCCSSFPSEEAAAVTARGCSSACEGQLLLPRGSIHGGSNRNRLHVLGSLLQPGSAGEQAGAALRSQACFWGLWQRAGAKSYTEARQPTCLHPPAREVQQLCTPSLPSPGPSLIVSRSLKTSRYFLPFCHSPHPSLLKAPLPPPETCSIVAELHFTTPRMRAK